MPAGEILDRAAGHAGCANARDVGSNTGRVVGEPVLEVDIDGEIGRAGERGGVLEISASVTRPSSRPSVAACPPLVVATAENPTNANNLAVPRSHALGRSSGASAWWSARNFSHAIGLCAHVLKLAALQPWAGAATNVGVSDTARDELDGHVATITYNRPEALNAINGEMRTRSQRRVRPLPRRRRRLGRDRHRRGPGVLRGRRPARRRRLGRRVRGNFLGEADDQLVRERMGDLQAGHRRGQRLLPRLRADPGHVVRLRDRERAGRVRLSRGSHRRADDRRRDPAPAADHWHDAMELLLTGDRIGADARQGDRPRRVGRCPMTS